MAFGLYSWTGSQALISCGDSAERTGAAARFGVAHAPGDPLFTMGGGIFAKILPGPPAQSHFQAAYNAAQMASTVDPDFSLAMDLRDRMALKMFPSTK